MTAAQAGVRLHKSFLATMAEELRALRFADKRGNIFYRALSSDPCVLGTVGLIRGPFAEDGSHSVDPIVGVRNEKIEEVLATLLPRRSKHWMPTTTTNLGYLSPDDEYLTRRIDRDSDLRATAREIAGGIAALGLPWMERLVDLDALVKAVGDDVGREEKLPIALMLSGRADEAKDIVASELSALGRRQDEGAQEYRAFATAFLTYVDEAGSRL